MEVVIHRHRTCDRVQRLTEEFSTDVISFMEIDSESSEVDIIITSTISISIIGKGMVE